MLKEICPESWQAEKKRFGTALPCYYAVVIADKPSHFYALWKEHYEAGPSLSGAGKLRGGLSPVPCWQKQLLASLRRENKTKSPRSYRRNCNRKSESVTANSCNISERPQEAQTESQKKKVLFWGGFSFISAATAQNPNWRGATGPIWVSNAVSYLNHSFTSLLQWFFVFDRFSFFWLCRKGNIISFSLSTTIDDSFLAK